MSRTRIDGITPQAGTHHILAVAGDPGLTSAAERHGPGGPVGLQNQCGRATHGSVGSTPAPLRQTNPVQPSGTPAFEGDELTAVASQTLRAVVLIEPGLARPVSLRECPARSGSTRG